MALASVATGDTVAAADVNQFKNALEGAATATFLLNAAATTHFQVKLADAAGSYTFKVLDSAGSAVATIDSDGNLTLAGGFTPSTLTLPAASSPSQTAEGQVVWDSDDNLLTIGDGASRQTFYPGGAKYKYKTADQNFTITTFADVTATAGNLAFAVAANTAYEIDFHCNFSALGTAGSGGAKLAITFPASPTYIQVYHATPRMALDSATVATGPGITTGAATPTSGTAFVSNVSYLSTTTAGMYPGWVHVKVVIINGSTAGTVTIQSAQDTAAGTTTINEAFATLRLILPE